jgi:class 3 adenylate cyclase/tetratricopeptide (TPR) repeat protein
VAESRRTVTVVFSDVTGSTALGEELDPEAVRRIMARYFEEARDVLERHGASVEKFIGDAVMAVFGIPRLHEDDGLRAVRAAAELHRRIVALNEELHRNWGARIAVRTGVNTGEVVAGDAAQGQSFATGDAVNVAARLEQAAAPGEILIGESTRRLTRDAVRVEALEPLPLKGKTEPVQAWRLLEVLPDVPAFTRRIDAPFVDRVRELAALRGAFERGVEGGACQLVTVLGPPGLGKSRLAREFLAAVGDQARVVVGRCLPYGEGIMYWPLAEIVQQVAGRDPARLAELVAADESADLITERIAGATGLLEAAGRSEEISWAVRRLLEALARDCPLVVVLDDIQWAEPAFLDLVEYVHGFAGGPILLLALARPDLVETRPSWAAPRRQATTISLEPLSEADADTLIKRLASGERLPEPTRAEIVEASEGNPLFVEQMLALQVEDGGLEGELGVPPTIQALLAARIDRLDPGEREVIERAAVEGRGFHRGAVSELLPETSRDALGGHLMSLVRKELIRPDQAAFPGDDGFRFAHVLIRDAAYAGMAKELRADLHERFAAWLARASQGRLAEYEEILGYHLEQAYLYRAELGPVDAHGRALAGRACEHLLGAASRALARGDRAAQVRLVSRAAALLEPDDALRLELLTELGDALSEIGEFARAEELLSEAIERASAFQEARIEARGRVALTELRYSTQPGDISAVSEHRGEAEQAVVVLEDANDELGLARAWDLVASLHWGQGESKAAWEGWERSVEHAVRAGSRRDERAGLAWLASVALWGPMHQKEAKERCEGILERMKGDLTGEADLLGVLGCLHALEGKVDEARALQERREAIFQELGLEVLAAWGAHTAGFTEMLAGDAEAAERILRRAFETLERLGARAQLQVPGSYLAQALVMQGRYAEADALASSVELLDPTGIAEIALARCVRARAAASRGRPEEGERLAREGLALIDRTDFLIDRADARTHLVAVLAAAGRADEAGRTLEEALRLHEEKGNVVSAERVRARLTGSVR